MTNELNEQYQRSLNSKDYHPPGPRTEEGKKRSSQNAITHGLFAKTVLLPGESQEHFDQLLEGYHQDFKPNGTTEDNLIRDLADTEWRRLRIPNIEARAIAKALESGDIEMKFLNTYSIYTQRLTRDFQSTLKILNETQAARIKENGLSFRVAVIMYEYFKRKNLPWDPADHGFVFSTETLAKQLDYNQAADKAMRQATFYSTTKSMDETHSRDDE